MTVISLFSTQEAKAQYTSVYVDAGYPATYYTGDYYGGYYTTHSPTYVVRHVRHVRHVAPFAVYRPAPVVPCYRYAPPSPRPGFGFHLDINRRHGGHDGHDRRGDHRSHRDSGRRHRR
jgi:hypothetical protein